VSSPEVDHSGYDIIVEDRGIVRHIQLKASYVGGKTARQKIHTRLAGKPSGCVVWIYFDESTLQLGPFLFFGGSPGEPSPNIDDEKIARHTKGDQFGYKAERPSVRQLSKGKFTHYETIENVYDALFGSEE